MSRTPTAIEHGAKWLKARRGRYALGVFTGTTWRLFGAYCHLVDGWLCSREPGITASLRALLPVFQRSEWPLLAEVIACFGDWSHVEELWEKIRPPGAPLYFADNDGRFVTAGGGGE